MSKVSCCFPPVNVMASTAARVLSPVVRDRMTCAFSAWLRVPRGGKGDLDGEDAQAVSIRHTTPSVQSRPTATQYMAASPAVAPGVGQRLGPVWGPARF